MIKAKLFEMIKEYNVHHRKPRSIGGTEDKENLSRVPTKKHVAYHKLFENKDVYGIAGTLNETWIDPDYVMVPIHKTEVAKLLKQFPYKKLKTLLKK